MGDTSSHDRRAGLERMLEAHSVAVVGASVKPGSLGASMMEELRRGGYEGAVYPVNPGYDEIDGYNDLAPNFKSSIIDYQVIGPYDMEQDLGLIGGNIFHGELSVDQLFHMRPAPGFADFRTPVRGLYHGSCATHGGGGVNGIPGWQAYKAAKKDKLVKKTG